MREIVLDTETTGFEPSDGHKIVEIGAVELENFLPTGKTYHVYINPERDVPLETTAIHGLTTEFLENKPTFSQIFPEFLDFIQDSMLVIHNAAFDVKFLNWELKNVGHPGLNKKRVTDSLEVARKLFPGSPASLDALCKRFNIDLSEREFHGALLDARLLGDVWLELKGGRQRGLELAAETQDLMTHNVHVERTFRKPRKFDVPAEEAAAHQAMVEALGENALWKTADD